MNAYSSISNASVIQYNSRAEINNPHLLSKEEKHTNGRDNTRNWVVNSFYRSKPAQGGRKSSTAADTSANNNTTDSYEAQRRWQKKESASPSSLTKRKPIHFDQYVVDVTADRFKYCLVGKFPNYRPGLEQIRKWAGESWMLEGEWSITLLSHSQVFIKLCNKKDMIEVWGQNRWLVLGHLMKVFKWSAAYRPSEEDPSQAAVWVLFPSLPVVYFVEDLLNRIVSSVGEVLCMDELTKNLTRTHFARVCVVVDLLAELPSRVWIGVGKGGFWQDVSYEKLPFYCSNCHLQGDHSVQNCKVEKPAVSDGEITTQGPVLNQQSEITSVPPSDIFSDNDPRGRSTDVTRTIMSQNKSREGIRSAMPQLKMNKNKQEHESSSQSHRPTKPTSSTEIIPIATEHAEERVLNGSKDKDSDNIKDQHHQRSSSSKSRRVHRIRTLNWRVFFCWRKKLEKSRSQLSSTTEVTGSLRKKSSKLPVIKEIEPYAAMANSATPWTLWKPVADKIRPTILHKYTSRDIARMTRSFRETIGKGGSANVYIGELDNHGHVAVKVYIPNTPHGEYLFQNEMNVATMPRHDNIVKVLGFCYDETTRALVMEYAPLGALEKLIHSDNLKTKDEALSCHKKYQIAVGLAEGINYLHTACNVLHRDIKPSNVLLDVDCSPKLGDFGLSPEAMNLERMSSKLDVYGYGIVLLEMLMRRKPYGSRVFPDDEHIVDIAHKVFNGPGLLGYVSDSEMNVERKMMQVALWCTQAKAEDRPSMTKVLDMLQGHRHVDDSAAPPISFIGDSVSVFDEHIEDSSRATMTFSTIDGR